MNNIEELQREVHQLDELLQPVANAEVDINGPGWEEKFEAQHHQTTCLRR